MGLFVVRHGKAGQRDAWDGPDRLRPLSRAGRAQSEGLATWLVHEAVSRVLSSPATRCVQTVQPLAGKLGLEVEVVEGLNEAMPFEPALELMRALPDHSVLCSHGDLIQDLMEALTRRGTIIEGAADWRKGSTWVLEREDGVVVRAHAVPPPL